MWCSLCDSDHPVGTPCLRHGSSQFDNLSRFKPYAPIKPLETYRPPEIYEPYEPIKPLETYNPFENLKPLEPIKPLETYEPFEALKPFETFKLLEPVEPLEYRPLENFEPPDPLLPAQIRDIGNHVVGYREQGSSLIQPVSSMINNGLPLQIQGNIVRDTFGRPVGQLGPGNMMFPPPSFGPDLDIG